MLHSIRASTQKNWKGKNLEKRFFLKKTRSKQEQLKFISLMSIYIFACIIAITCSIPPPPTLQDFELLPY